MASNRPETEQKTFTNESPEENEALKNTSSATTTDIPSFGWSQYAERVNGRFAMIGFLAILIIEILSQSNFLDWSGLIP